MQTPDASFAQALSLYRNGQPDLAATACQAILSNRPSFGGAFHLLGIIAFQQGHNLAARDLLQQATRCSDATPEMFNTLGSVCNAMGDGNAAIGAFQCALALKPDCADSLSNLGVLYRNRLQIDKAVELLRRALAIDPNHAHAKANLKAAYRDVVPGWHFSMLEDEKRNDAYEAAIARAAPGKDVLDIGSGAGLLTLMAARHGAKRVTGCEAVTVVAEQAQKIVARNGFESRARIWPRRSQDLVVGRELPQRAELLVTEIFSSGVINEGVLTTVEHAQQNLLTADAAIIPRACSAMGHLVGGEFLKDILFMDRVSGFDLSLFDDFASPDKLIQLDRHPHDVLSDDIELVRFDLQARGSLTARRERLHRVPVTRRGLCLGVGQWLRLELDETTRYENRPNLAAPMPSAWLHVVYRFQKPRRVSAGDVLTVLVRNSSTQIAVELVEEASPF